MNDATNRLGTIGQLALTVSDQERSIAFYKDALGLKFLFQAPKLAFFDCDGIRLMLSSIEKGPSAPSSNAVYFKVADIRAAHADLVRRGVKFEGEPHFVAPLGTHDLWMAFLRDPDGNLLALMSEVQR